MAIISEPPHILLLYSKTKHLVTARSGADNPPAKYYDGDYREPKKPSPGNPVSSGCEKSRILLCVVTRTVYIYIPTVRLSRNAEAAAVCRPRGSPAVGRFHNTISL